MVHLVESPFIEEVKQRTALERVEAFIATLDEQVRATPHARARERRSARAAAHAQHRRLRAGPGRWGVGFGQGQNTGAWRCTVQQDIPRRTTRRHER